MRSYFITIFFSFFLTQCFFSKVVQEEFFGDIGENPETENRFVTGLALSPFVLLIDAASSPFQLLLLAIFGDDAFPNIFAYSEVESSYSICLNSRTKYQHGAQALKHMKKTYKKIPVEISVFLKNKDFYKEIIPT
ncbi:MAG: hypothetical protein AB8C84_04735 [Oligoflexales bacterium]